MVAPSGTLLDLVVADAVRAPFPARSNEPEQLVLVVWCRSGTWPEARGATVAVTGQEGCRVADLSRVGDVSTTPTKVRPRSAP